MTDVSTASGRRPYDSPVRRARVAATREEILRAAAEIALESPTWEWGELTFDAVGQRAGVSRRTVYRHFPSDAELRAGVMRHLGELHGIDYEVLDLDEVAPVGATSSRSSTS